MKSEVKKDIKNCAYDLFLCCGAGSEIVIACSLAKFINVMDVDLQCCEAVGCALGASIGGSVLMAYSVEKLFKHGRELKSHLKDKKVIDRG